MNKSKPNWIKIKAEFTAGATLKELSEKYNIKFATVVGRHVRDKWADARKKTIIKTSEKTLEKLVDKQSDEAVEEVTKLQEIADTIQSKLQDAEIGSLEGAGGALAKLYQVMGTYTGKTVQKTEHSGQVEVIPIFGSHIKANVPTYNSNKEDN